MPFKRVLIGIFAACTLGGIIWLVSRSWTKSDTPSLVNLGARTQTQPSRSSETRRITIRAGHGIVTSTAVSLTTQLFTIPTPDGQPAIFTLAQKNSVEAQAKIELLALGKQKLAAAIGEQVAAYVTVRPVVTVNAAVGERVANIIARVSGDVVGVAIPQSILLSDDDNPSAPPTITIQEFNVNDGTATVIVSPALATTASPQGTQPVSVVDTSTSSNDASDSGSSIELASPENPSAALTDTTTIEYLQSDEGPGNEYVSPAQSQDQAIAACHDKSSGSPCGFSTPEYVFTGTCSIIFDGAILTCVSDGR